MMSEKWSAGINRMSRKPKRKKKDNQRKEIAGKKNKDLLKKEHEQKDKEETGKITDKMAQRKEDNPTATMAKTANNWLEIIAKFASILTVLISAYTFFMLWTIERYLEKYHIDHINAQSPSKTSMLKGIAAAFMTMAITLLWEPYYLKLKKQRGLIRLLLYVGACFILLVGIFSANLLLPSHALNFRNILTLLEFRTATCRMLDIFLIIAVLSGLTLVGFEFLLAKTQVPRLLLIFGVAPVIAAYTAALFQIINKDAKTLPTIHIQTAEEMEGWEDNIPITDDGKQIWAVVYENSEYYFAEPIDISRSGDFIDTTHVITLEKADVILYTETVEQVLSKYKKPCGLNNP